MDKKMNLKFFIIAVIMLIPLSTVWAQGTMTDFLPRKYGGDPCFQTENDDNYFVWFAQPGWYGLIDKGFIVLPKNGGQSREIFANHPLYWFVTCYEDDQNLVAIYRNDTKTTFEICLNIIPKDAQKYVWAPKTVWSIPKNEQLDFRVVSAVSPDKRKAGLAIFQMQFKTSNLQKVYMVSFDENGMNNDLTLDIDFEGADLQLIDFVVDDEANLYTALLSYNKKEEKNGDIYENETLHLYQCGEYGVQNSVEEEVDFGHVTGGKLLHTRNGKLVLGGYYATKPKGQETGCFFATTSVADFNDISFSRQDFPNTYFDYKHSKTGQMAEEFHVYPIDFQEFSDGNIVLLGDMQAHWSDIAYYTIGGPILLHFADMKGEINGFKTITKNQSVVGQSKSPTGMRESIFSYYALMDHDVIHLIFPVNIANFKGEPDKNLLVMGRVFGSGLDYDEACAAHCTVNSRQEVSAPELLMEYKTMNSYMIMPLFIENDGFIMYRSGKRTNMISKLAYPLSPDIIQQ